MLENLESLENLEFLENLEIATKNARYSLKNQAPRRGAA